MVRANWSTKERRDRSLSLVFIIIRLGTRSKERRDRSLSLGFHYHPSRGATARSHFFHDHLRALIFCHGHCLLHLAGRPLAPFLDALSLSLSLWCTCARQACFFIILKLSLSLYLRATGVIAEQTHEALLTHPLCGFIRSFGGALTTNVDAATHLVARQKKGWETSEKIRRAALREQVNPRRCDRALRLRPLGIAY